jgi:hypothetical protein
MQKLSLTRKDRAVLYLLHCARDQEVHHEVNWFRIHDILYISDLHAQLMGEEPTFIYNKTGLNYLADGLAEVLKKLTSIGLINRSGKSYHLAMKQEPYLDESNFRFSILAYTSAHEYSRKWFQDKGEELRNKAKYSKQMPSADDVEFSLELHWNNVHQELMEERERLAKDKHSKLGFLK